MNDFNSNELTRANMSWLPIKCRMLSHPYTFLFSVVILGIQSLFLNQDIAAQTPISRPAEFYTQDKTGNPCNATITGNKWFVISDRDNNAVFTNPGLTSKVTGRTFRLNDVLWVVEKKSNAIRVAPHIDPSDGSALFAVSGTPLPTKASRIDALDDGWISLDNVMKFLNCQKQGECTGSVRDLWLRKGIVAVTTNQSEELKFYNLPNLSGNGTKAGSSEFFYVFKEVESKTASGKSIISYLVGLYDQVDIARCHLKGWINSSIFTLWPNNVGYEPNWDLGAESVFLANHVRPWVFKKNTPGCPNIFPKPSEYPLPAGPCKTDVGIVGSRMDGSQPRLISLDYSGTANQKRIGLVNDPCWTENGVQRCIDRYEFGYIRGLVDSLMAEFQKVNVILAIDGTQSMEKYRNVFIPAIKDATDWIYQSQQNGTVTNNMSFRFSILVYRDGSDFTNYSFSGWKTSYSALTTFMAGQKFWDPHSPPDHPEALFYGLNSIFNHFPSVDKDFGKGSANYLFVIGDAGNRNISSPGVLNPNPLESWETDSRTALVNNLKEYFINLIGIQIGFPNGASPSLIAPYQNFSSQTKDLIKEISYYKNEGKSDPAIFNETTPPSGSKIFSINSQFRHLGNSSLMYFDKANDITVDEVKTKITSSLTNISTSDWENQKSNLYLRLWNDVKCGPIVKNIVDNSLPAFKNIVGAILNTSINVSGMTVLQQWVEEGMILRKIPNMSIPIFYDCMRLSDLDKDIINQALDKLVITDLDFGKIPAGPVALRGRIVDNWISILTDVLNLYRIADRNIMMDLTLTDLSKILTGTSGPRAFESYIDPSTGKQEPLRLRHILNSKIMSDNQIYNYIGSFILTKYCLNILRKSKDQRPTYISNMFFRNYSKIFKLYLEANSLVFSKIEFEKAYLGLPAKLDWRFFDFHPTFFSSPIDGRLGAKKYEWVDCRIFPNDRTHELLICTVRKLLDPTFVGNCN